MGYRSMRFYMVLLIIAAVVTMGTKLTGYFLTGSVGLFSDAAESLVNFVAVLVNWWTITLTARAANEAHAYGHTEWEYFASGAKRALILAVAVVIVFETIPHLLHPQPLEHIGLGLVFSGFGAAVNGGLAWFMLRTGKHLRSITLEADAHRLLMDIWITVSVVVGVLLVSPTGWLILDPIIALVVTANIILTGVRLLRETGLGLLDATLPAEDFQPVQAMFAPYRAQGVQFHALRTQQVGTRWFISFHVLIPGAWTVQQGWALCEEIEIKMRKALPDSTVLTHLEPREDSLSWDDQELDRSPLPSSFPPSEAGSRGD